MIKRKNPDLSLTHRFYVFNHDNILMVSVLAAFDCQTPDTPLPEDDVWALLKQARGKEVMDEGLLKNRAEFLVHGACYAPDDTPAKAVPVSVSVGKLSKRLIAFGDRFWLDERGRQPRISEPVPFRRMALGWDKAFGGPEYRINPYGKGAVWPVSPDGQGCRPLPNLEDPAALMASPEARPEPAGFGPLGRMRFWRGMHAGTYDDNWLAEHWPHPAPDADRNLLNWACPDQWYDGFFSGGEEVRITGMRPGGEVWRFHLPALRARLFLRRQLIDQVLFEELATHFDTAWFFPDAGRMVCIWRALTLVSGHARDITHVHAVFEPQANAALPKEHYFARIGGPELTPDPAPQKPAPATPAPEPAATGPEPAAARPEPDAEASLSAPLPGFALPDVQAELAAIFAKAGLEPPPPDFTLKDLEALAGQAARHAGSEPPPPPPDLAGMNGLPLHELLARAQTQFDALMAKAGIAPRAFAPPESPGEAELLARLETLAAKDPQLGQAVAQLKALSEEVAAAPSPAPPAERPELPTPPPRPRESRLEVPALMDRARATRNLAGLDMTGLDFSGRDLAGVSLAGAVLENAVLRECNLSGADLSGAVLTGADLSRARCPGARFSGATAGKMRGDEASFSRAMLDRADLTGASLARADLSEADLSLAIMEKSCLTGARLSGCRAAKASFAGADLRAAELRGSELSGANFSRCALDGADLSGAKAPAAWFTDATVREARLVGTGLAGCRAQGGADFSGADFSGADLSGAILEDCDMVKARLTAARLDRASLRGCRLQGADLSRAIARWAFFDGGDLAGANLNGINAFKASFRETVLHLVDLSDSNCYSVDFFQARFHKTRFAGANTKQTLLAKLRRVEL